MKICAILCFLVISAAVAVPHCLGRFGLSGWHGLPTSDMMPRGDLRAGAVLQYIDTEAGSILSLPLRGCIGFREDVELAAEVPLVLSDDAFEGSAIGDISLSGGWLYETTRGGTALKLTGRITLPTGEEYRDSGAELAFGGVTSTTFVDFRLSMAGEYALNGGRDPFDEKITDVFRFTGGGASYITSDFLLSASLSGSTAGEFTAMVSSEYLLNDQLAITGGISAGLDEFTDFGVHAGAYWTESGVL